MTIERLLKAMILMAVVGVFVGAVGLGVLLIVSGGNPISWVQNTFIRFSLSSRTEEINRAIGTNDTPIRFSINSGDAPALVARNLVNASLIADPVLFVNYLRAEGLDTQLEAGVYFLNQAQNIPQIANTLIDSRNSSIRFRVVEGTRLEEVAEAIDAIRLFGFTGAEFLATTGVGASIDPDLAGLLGVPVVGDTLQASLEGFMFPDTYVFPPDITALELRDQLLEAFVGAVGVPLFNDATTQGWTMRQAVTLASIAEREAVWDDEHVLITSVYRNRLDVDMLLQADPTVQYALNGTRGRWWTNITQADYRNVTSPYNTYLNKGLPPSPIASPSLSAIRAAIYPAESSYFYFRARCDGSNYHNFATTYDEHLANGC